MSMVNDKIDQLQKRLEECERIVKQNNLFLMQVIENANEMKKDIDHILVVNDLIMIGIVNAKLEK